VSRVADYHGTETYQRYLAWDAENPDFYSLFERFALELARAGKTALGARLVGERIRWETTLQTAGDEFKINDHFHPIYARRFMDDYPEFDGLFRTREVRAH
jgi:hypothetical protein